MTRHHVLALLIVVAATLTGFADQSIVVLGETPVTEFSLPDGSVLKNAFVWRRNSEGMMIVHDDGQYFLNFKLLPPDWSAAYLGTPEETEPKRVTEAIEVDDRYGLDPTLQNIPELTPRGRQYILRKDADAEAEKTALALALIQNLLDGKGEEAKRILLTIEEKGHGIDAVTLDKLFSDCDTCGGDGQGEKDCETCSGTGKCPKCDGEGERKTGIGQSTIYCTTCRGKGICSACAGAKQLEASCRRCRGKGKLLEREYCEIRLDAYVQAINAQVDLGLGVVVTETDAVRIETVFKEIPKLTDTRDYFFSDAYDGAADTNILAVCMLYSLLKERSEEAAHFYTMLQVNYPDAGVIILEDYLKPCTACEKTGKIERDCNECSGSGKCKRCDGEGERTSDFKEAKIHCTTCRGSGKCTGCGGDGTLAVRCGACDGTGRFMDEQRCQIKLQILINGLVDFYESHPK